MSDDGLGDLPDDIADILESERRLAPTPDARKRRMMGRLEAELGLGVAGLVGTVALSKMAAKTKPVWLRMISGALGTKTKVVLSIALIGVGTGVVVRSMGGSSTSSADTTLPSPAAAPGEALPLEPSPVVSAFASAPPVASEATALMPPSNPRVEPSRLASPASTTHEAVPAQLPSDEALRQERALLASARSAIDRGDPSSALARLAEHARSFSSGRLVEEREALRVEALRARGDIAGADAASRDFARRFPESVLEDRVKHE